MCCRRDDLEPLLTLVSVLTDEYDWSLLIDIDCVDGWVVRTFSFCDTVDVFRWCRCIWDVWLSAGDLPDVSAVILLNTSFLMIVGDEHGLTDGVLFADIVLLL